MRSECSERWIKYYSSSHNILLVGEGDFSFSLCLGLTFGSATNIVATTLDSYEGLINKYKYAEANLRILGILGASVLHGVDATQMTAHPFLRMHRDLVRRFLLNASLMLCMDGEIHVNHKTTAPFDGWRIQDLGSECSLVCVGQDEFRIKDYPGYNNKRGSGERADEPFPLGSCKTYRFRLSFAAVRNLLMRKGDLMPGAYIPPFASQMFPPPPQPPSSHYDGRAALQNYYASECRRIFGRYLKHMEETFGDTSYDARRSVIETLQYGYEKYLRDAAPGRPLSEFTRILEELHHLSISRSERLRQMVLRYGLS